MPTNAHTWFAHIFKSVRLLFEVKESGDVTLESVDEGTGTVSREFILIL